MAREEDYLTIASSITEIEELLKALEIENAQIDSKLEALLDPTAQPDIGPLTNIQSSLHFENQILNLKQQIGPTAQTAYELKESVAKLDLEQARVTECLKYVEDVQELKVSLTFLCNPLIFRVQY